MQNNWEEFGQHFVDISGTLLPEALVQVGRAENPMLRMRSNCITKVPRQTAIDRGIEPTLVLVPWFDVNKGDESKHNVPCGLVGK